ncbi:murein hydrolase activator EnvC family protein [Foetidibacter luteolus]|uniref:murein hydrolase activator EnvC family protein n=1 Tax=Foetidibacter luteolus TaxID=2608880 RepID=UPI00129B9975|nr:peptidoglycan DD-metalloendopeptidase family protein [Foetidibacter luteolus]
MKKLFLATLLFSFLNVGHAQQTKEEIQKRQQELQQEIDELNRNLQETKKNKKQSLSQYALIQRKLKARAELINNLNKEMKKIDDEIFMTNRDIYRYKNELDTLKDNYAKSILFAYKNRSNYDYLNFLFSATSFNDAVKRVAYLKSYRQYRETQADNIFKTQDVLRQKNVQLAGSKNEKNKNIGEQNKQLNVLQADKSEVNDVLAKLKSDEKNLSTQIRDRERTRTKLQQALRTIINREIAEAKKREQQRLERERQERLAREEAERKRRAEQQKQAAAANAKPADNTKPAVTPGNTEPEPAATKPTLGAATTGLSSAPKTDRTYSPFESTTEGLTLSLNFENNRNKLPWPVDAGFVSVHFGSYEIPNTKLKGYSDGIDISLPVGSSVKAVAEGEVSTIFDLGTQTVVVRHGKYFTTYSNLSTVNVTKGQQVRPGTVVGKAAAGSDGEGILTFMVTNDKGANLNPEAWLRRR